SLSFEVLLSTLHHSNEGLRREAILSLVKFPDRSTEVIRELISLLKREHRTSVLLVLLEHLGELGKDQIEVREAVDAACAHPNSTVADKAALVARIWR
ncbi:MAG: hypothetical protein P1V97_27895, partial [Planctomycetota bacterium]|nr:hypothetical protein [Planctomycetota bacterium]